MSSNMFESRTTSVSSAFFFCFFFFRRSQTVSVKFGFQLWHFGKTLALTRSFFSPSTQRQDCQSRVMVTRRRSAARHHQNPNLRLHFWSGQTAVISDKWPEIHVLMSVRLLKGGEEEKKNTSTSHWVISSNSLIPRGVWQSREEERRRHVKLLWSPTLICMFYVIRH